MSKSEPWFRMYHATLDNPKVQKLPGEQFKTWVNLLCLASRTAGRLPSDADIAFGMRMPLAKVQPLLKRFIDAELIDTDGDGLVMHDWDVLQFKSDVSTERVKKFRERRKKRPGNVSPPVSETPMETDQIQNRTDSVPHGTGADAPPDGRPDPVKLYEALAEQKAAQANETPLKDRIFGPALAWLIEKTGRTEKQLRPLVGKWCSQSGDGPTLDAINSATKNAPLDPIPYIERVLKPKAKTDAKQNATDHLAGLASALGARTVATAEPEPVGEGRVIDGDCRVVGEASTGEPAGICGSDDGADRVCIGLRHPVSGPESGTGDLPRAAAKPASGLVAQDNLADQANVGMAQQYADARGPVEHGEGRSGEAPAAVVASSSRSPEGPRNDGAEERHIRGAVRGASPDPQDELEIPSFLDQRHKLRAAS